MLTIAAPYPLRRPLNLVAVQMKVTLADYESEQSFRERVSASVQPVVESVPKGEDALVVLPEDVGLGLALTSDFHAVKDCHTLGEAGRKILLRHAPRIMAIASRCTVPMVRALLIYEAAFIQQVYQRTFSELARRHGWYLMAGSAPMAERGSLYNEGILFGPNGEALLHVRKIQLVPLEEEEGLNLCRGDERARRAIELPIGIVGVAICFDAFHPEIVDPLVAQGARLMLQPSFNPFSWTREQAEEWQTGLHAAAQRHRGLIGVNPMMVGRLFDVAGEGRSSIVIHRDLSDDGTGYLARAASPTSEETLIVRLEPA